MPASGSLLHERTNGGGENRSEPSSSAFGSCPNREVVCSLCEELSSNQEQLAKRCKELHEEEEEPQDYTQDTLYFDNEQLAWLRSLGFTYRSIPRSIIRSSVLKLDSLKHRRRKNDLIMVFSSMAWLIINLEISLSYTSHQHGDNPLTFFFVSHVLPLVVTSSLLELDLISRKLPKSVWCRVPLRVSKNC
ncbi:hypothetical protein V3C99_008912 [Haemonchus contortus]